MNQNADESVHQSPLFWSEVGARRGYKASS